MDKSRIYSIGTDGRYLVFIRFRDNQFEVEGPWPISPIGTERLLRAIVSLGANGESFIPDNLVRDFGSDSKLAKPGIANLYNCVVNATDPKTIVLFNEWKMLFSEVCGYDVSGQHQKVKKAR